MVNLPCYCDSTREAQAIQTSRPGNPRIPLARSRDSTWAGGWAMQCDRANIEAIGLAPSPPQTPRESYRVRVWHGEVGTVTSVSAGGRNWHHHPSCTSFPDYRLATDGRDAGTAPMSLAEPRDAARTM